MPAFQIGAFYVDVWEGGHPVWITLRERDNEGIKLSHKDLYDLEYAVAKAIKAARDALPPSHKHEMDR
jgi:hypothetical protein